MKKACFVSFLALTAASPALADAGEAAGDGWDDTIVVTASRGEGIAIDTLGSSVTVIKPVDLVDRQTVIVSDVLRDVPGVSVNRTGPVGGLTQVRIRGAEGDHTLVLIDGIEAADAYSGDYSFAMLVSDPGARIEVLRGEQSALYGSDAIGGVINYITADGREMPGVAGRIEGGSFGTVHGALRVAGAGGDFDYALGGSYAGAEGYVVAPGGSRNIGSRIGTVHGKVNYDAGALKLRAVVRYNHTDADLNNQDYMGTGNAIDSGGHYTNSALYGLVGAQFIAADGRWITDLSGQINDSRRHDFDDAGMEIRASTGRRRKGSLVSTLKLGDSAMTHTLTAAVDYERESYRGTASYITGPNPFRHTDNWGLVAQYQLTLGDRLGLGGAVRHDFNDRFRDATTWHLHASYRLPTGTRLHAAGGTGVKAPTFFELFGYSPTSGFVGNADTRPERSTGWEVGVEQAFLNGRARIDVTYFNARLRDKIITVYAPTYTIVNGVGVSPHQGVEVSADLALPAGFRFNGSYTYLDAADEIDAELVRRPRHIGSANLAWRSPDDRFGAGVTVRYNGDARDTNFATYQTVTLKAYTLVNLTADFRVMPGVSLYGRIENLFDDDYQENVGFLAAGRAAYGGVRVHF